MLKVFLSLSLSSSLAVSRHIHLNHAFFFLLFLVCFSSLVSLSAHTFFHLHHTHIFSIFSSIFFCSLIRTMQIPESYPPHFACLLLLRFSLRPSLRDNNNNFPKNYSPAQSTLSHRIYMKVEIRHPKVFFAGGLFIDRSFLIELNESSCLYAMNADLLLTNQPRHIISTKFYFFVHDTFLNS